MSEFSKTIKDAAKYRETLDDVKECFLSRRANLSLSKVESFREETDHLRVRVERYRKR